MDVLTEQQHRALAFIAAANAGGYEPYHDEVDAWLRNSTGGPMQTWMYTTQLSHLAGSGGTVAHLSKLGWATETYGHVGIQLTALGRALLRSADADEDAGAQVVVLDSNDPLAYPALVGELAAIGDALLVDPYLDVQGASDLLLSTQIRRVLMSDADGARSKRAAITTFLRSSDAAGFEVRATDGLHDRMVIADNGHVWTIGASLNGIQRRKSTTVLTPMPDAAAEVLARNAQEAWGRGEPLLHPAEEDEDKDAD